MSNLQQFVWSILYSFHLNVANSCELRSIKYVIEKSVKFDLLAFFTRTKQMIAATESVSPEVLLLDQVFVPLKELTQVLAAIFQKMLVKKTHLLTLLQSRSKDRGLVAADICAILIVDFVKCRDKCADQGLEIVAENIKEKRKEETKPVAAVRSTSKTKRDNVGGSGQVKAQQDSVRTRMSKSIMKTSKEYTSPYSYEKSVPKKMGKSMTPGKSPKKVTLDLTGTKHEQTGTLRTTLGELTLNRDRNDHYLTMINKPRCGGLKKGSKQTKSVFLPPENDDLNNELANALVVKKEIEYHLQETVPRYEDYKKQMELKKKKVDIFKDKQALM